MSEAPSIRAIRLSKSYGHVAALLDVTLELEAGVFGLLGPNGSGKSSLLGLVSGQLRPSNGDLLVCGRRPFDEPEVLRRIGLCPEADSLFEELTAHDALAAHLEVELNIDQDDVANPWAAAAASALSFLIGAILPMLAILLPPETARIPVCFAAVMVVLILTGTISATIGGSRRLRATLRVVIGGLLALAATFLVGRLLGTAGLGG